MGEKFKMDLKDTGSGGGGGVADWFHLAREVNQVRAVKNTVM